MPDNETPVPNDQLQVAQSELVQETEQPTVVEPLNTAPPIAPVVHVVAAETEKVEMQTRVACLHCAYRGAASNTNDDPHVTSMVKCENCGLPMCNVCVEELEQGCPA